MRFLTCTTSADPCPIAEQAWSDLSDLLNPALLGIDSAAILQAFTWGFGAVMLGYMLGYGLGLILGLIRQV